MAALSMEHLFRGNCLRYVTRYAFLRYRLVTEVHLQSASAQESMDSMPSTEYSACALDPLRTSYLAVHNTVEPRPLLGRPALRIVIIQF